MRRPWARSGQRKRLDRAVDDPPRGELVGAHGVDQVGLSRPEADVLARRSAKGAAGDETCEWKTAWSRSRSFRSAQTTGSISSSKWYGDGGGVAARHVLDSDVVLEQDEPACLVRQLGVCVRDERGPHVGGTLPPDRALHGLLEVLLGGLPEVRGDVLPAGVGEDRHDHALVHLLGDLARDVDGRAAGDAGEDALELEQRPHASTDSAFETSILRSSLETSRIGGT